MPFDAGVVNGAERQSNRSTSAPPSRRAHAWHARRSPRCCACACPWRRPGGDVPTLGLLAGLARLDPLRPARGLELGHPRDDGQQEIPPSTTWASSRPLLTVVCPRKALDVKVPTLAQAPPGIAQPIPSVNAQAIPRRRWRMLHPARETLKAIEQPIESWANLAVSSATVPAHSCSGAKLPARPGMPPWS